MIDWNRVNLLQEEVGVDEFDEVIELFFYEIRAAIETFQSQTFSAVEVEEQLHFLRGAALNLGFEAMAQMCQAGEQAAAKGTTDTVHPNDVSALFEASAQQFEADRANKLAA